MGGDALDALVALRALGLRALGGGGGPSDKDPVSGGPAAPGGGDAPIPGEPTGRLVGDLPPGTARPTPPSPTQRRSPPSKGSAG